MGKSEDQGKSEPDVKVHLTKGCELDGRKDQHTHPQDEWRSLIDSKGEGRR